jgi:urease accessory protein
MLNIQAVGGASAATSVRSVNPFKLLVPRPRGPSVWAFTSSFGGGLVAGDETRLDLRLDSGTRCFLGSQSATKVYRNPARLPCSHRTNAWVGSDALLVWAPDAVQLFAEASFHQRQHFHLEPGASLVLLDWFTSGRSARGERWQFHQLQTWNEVAQREENATGALPDADRDGAGAEPRRVFIDSVRLRRDDGPLGGAHRTGAYNCFATLLLLGPHVEAMGAKAVASIQGQPVARSGPILACASPLARGAVLRVAGLDMETVGRELRQHLGPLVPLLGDDPWARKW